MHWTRTKSCVSVLIKLTSKNVLTPIVRDWGESPGDDVTTYNTDSGDAWWSLKTAIKMSADDYCVYWETHKIAAQCARPNNRVTEPSGRETSDRRGICPVHPGFSPLYVRRVSVRLASALPAAEPEDTRTQSRDLTLNPAAGEFHRIPEAPSLTKSTGKYRAVLLYLYFVAW